MKLFKFELRTDPVASRSVFTRRLLAHGGAAGAMMLLALAVGMTGYRITEGMAWLDAFVNAAMILSGMGPVGELHTPAGKLFAGCYALFSGVVFLLIAGVMISPLAHRLMHKLHMEEPED